MTNEEALYCLKNFRNGCSVCQFPQNEECFRFDAKQMAVSALEKQIPKKPNNITYDDGYVEFWNCPNCHNQHTAFINDEQYKYSYCPLCGQSIDWTEVE